FEDAQYSMFRNVKQDVIDPNDGNDENDHNEGEDYDSGQSSSANNGPPKRKRHRSTNNNCTMEDHTHNGNRIKILGFRSSHPGCEDVVLSDKSSLDEHMRELHQVLPFLCPLEGC